MLRNYVPAQRKTDQWWEVMFDDGHMNGFGFPCNSNGELIPETNEVARKNYEWCMAHPERFARFNHVIKRINHYTQPAHGTCVCGTDVELFDTYYGACQCPGCGRWYNLFGQHLLPPEQWMIDPSDDEPY